MKQAIETIASVMGNRIPGQLVIQITDRCNGRCPQCGMRVTQRFARSTLPADAIKRMLDAAAQKGVKAVSFTGGEPLLVADTLVELIRHAGKAGIRHIRTGTNGFVFQNSADPGFARRIHRLAGQLAQSPLRNFWISIDSADPATHERMRGLAGVVAGIAKALPIFHDHGIYPSANLGLNRNVGGTATRDLKPSAFDDPRSYAQAFYHAYREALHRFYRRIIDLGFTMANTCYPMSIGAAESADGLEPVYAATDSGEVVRFTRHEKALLFQALLETIPHYRSRIRIFSPLCALHALCRHYREPGGARLYGCRGGIDFFFVDARDGDTYPCGYRGTENLGKFWDLDPGRLRPEGSCRRCDWECFRDPCDLFGPLLEAFQAPAALAAKIRRDPLFYRLWLADLRYYRDCAFFDSRCAPNLKRMARWSPAPAFAVNAKLSFFERPSNAQVVT